MVILGINSVMLPVIISGMGWGGFIIPIISIGLIPPLLNRMVFKKISEKYRLKNPEPVLKMNLKILFWPIFIALVGYLEVENGNTGNGSETTTFMLIIFYLFLPLINVRFYEKYGEKKEAADYSDNKP